MSIQLAEFVQAVGSFSSTGGDTGLREVGAESARTGVGTYTLTLDNPLNAADGFIMLTPRAAALGAGIGYSVTHTTDTIKTINVVNGAGAPLDAGMDYMVFRLTPNLNG
jgi:hypothetical protein